MTKKPSDCQIHELREMAEVLLGIVAPVRYDIAKLTTEAERLAVARGEGRWSVLVDIMDALRRKDPESAQSLIAGIPLTGRAANPLGEPATAPH